MTAHERVWTVLRGETADQVPLTCYAGLLPQGAVERQLRDEGLALVIRCPVFETEQPNVETEHRNYRQNGVGYVRVTYRTPVGEVWHTYRTGGGYGTSLAREFPIKGPDDYKVVECMIRDERYSPDYESFVETRTRIGADGVVIGNLGYSPLQQKLVLLMGVERFAIDLVERPDLFFELYEVIAERHREQYALAAESPAEAFIYGDNITSEMVGLERFERYVVPRYNEFASYLHPQGKSLGVHMDGKLLHLKEAVARSQVDIIEAFAPFPDADLPLADARRAWPDKVIWLNYPSPVHLRSPEQIAAHTRQMLADIAPGDRCLFGVTENIPDHVWEQSMLTISRVVRNEGRLPLSGPVATADSVTR